MTLNVQTPAHPDPMQTDKRPHRAVVAGVALLTVLGLATAVTLPIILDDRHSSATTTMRAQLTQIAIAQDVWKAEHGTYTTRLDDLRLVESDGDLAIVHADAAGFCVGAYDSGTNSVLFYSADGSETTFDTSSCV